MKEHTSGPASLAVNHLDLRGLVSSKLLNMLHSTGHIIEVSLMSLVSGSSLPVSKSIGQNVGNHGVFVSVGSEEVIGSTIGELVPGIGGTDGDIREGLLNGADVLVQLGTGQVATVKRLRANGNGLDGVRVLRDKLLQGGEILLERSIVDAIVVLVLFTDPIYKSN